MVEISWSKCQIYPISRTLDLLAELIAGACFHLKSLLFPVNEVKAISNFIHVYYEKSLRRYAGQNEVRFKITDKQKEIYRETALYLNENNLMEKPNIQSFGRWCMDFVCKNYRLSVLEAKIMKQQQQRQEQMQQPPQMSYPTYFPSNPTQLF